MHATWIPAQMLLLAVLQVGITEDVDYLD
jgi:hypothetical protein